MYHTDEHFQKPFEFHPERWLNDDAFQNDDLDALQPFHLGPRNCIGRKYVSAKTTPVDAVMSLAC